MIRNLPIRIKLTFISMATSGAALLLACAAFLSYERVTFLGETTRNLSITAEIVGFNCAADLAFKDERAAEQTLKSLAAQPHIVGACIYGADGEIFAAYRRNSAGAPEWPVVRDNGELHHSDSLELFR